MRSLRYCPLRHPQQKPGASYPLKFPLIRHRCIFWHLPGINPAVRYDEQLIPVTGAGQAPVCPVCRISDLHMCFLFCLPLVYHFIVLLQALYHMRLCFGKSPENLWFPRPAGAFTWNISVRHMQACTSVFIPCSLLPSRTLYHIFFISTLYISVILPQLSHLYLHGQRC